MKEMPSFSFSGSFKKGKAGGGAGRRRGLCAGGQVEGPVSTCFGLSLREESDGSHTRSALHDNSSAPASRLLKITRSS